MSWAASEWESRKNPQPPLLLGYWGIISSPQKGAARFWNHPFWFPCQVIRALGPPGYSGGGVVMGGGWRVDPPSCFSGAQVIIFFRLERPGKKRKAKSRPKPPKAKNTLKLPHDPTSLANSCRTGSPPSNNQPPPPPPRLEMSTGCFSDQLVGDKR